MTVESRIGESVILDSKTVSVGQYEPLEIKFKTDESETEESLIKVQVVEEGGEESLVRSRIADDKSYLTVELVNISDVPGGMPKPMLVIKNQNGFDFFLDIKSSGKINDQYQLAYTLSKRVTAKQ